VTSNQAAQLFLEKSVRGERSEVESHATRVRVSSFRSHDPPTPSLFSWPRPKRRTRASLKPRGIVSSIGLSPRVDLIAAGDVDTNTASRVSVNIREREEIESGEAGEICGSRLGNTCTQIYRVQIFDNSSTEAFRANLHGRELIILRLFHETWNRASRISSAAFASLAKGDSHVRVAAVAPISVVFCGAMQP